MERLKYKVGLTMPDGSKHEVEETWKRQHEDRQRDLYSLIWYWVAGNGSCDCNRWIYIAGEFLEDVECGEDSYITLFEVDGRDELAMFRDVQSYEDPGRHRASKERER